MLGGPKWILNPFTRREKRKAWNRSRENLYAGKKMTKFSWNRWGLYCNQEEWLEEFLDDFTMVKMLSKCAVPMCSLLFSFKRKRIHLFCKTCNYFFYFLFEFGCTCRTRVFEVTLAQTHMPLDSLLGIHPKLIQDKSPLSIA